MAFGFACIVACVQVGLYIAFGQALATEFDETDFRTALLAGAVSCPVVAILYYYRPKAARR